jgi:hypothetical protein
MVFSRRLLSPLLVVSALFLSLPTVSAARSLRQHVETRSSLDVCATIDEYSLASVGLADSYGGCIDICLCLSTLPTAIQANSELSILAKKYGEDQVRVDLAQLVSFCTLCRRQQLTSTCARSTTPGTNRIATILITRRPLAPPMILAGSTATRRSSQKGINALVHGLTCSVMVCAACSAT